MLLPIYEFKDQIITTIRNNAVTIICGETGSGKTTQLPVMLYEACFSTRGIIGITEPRRIAATSVANYVAGQMSNDNCNFVSYKIRFDDQYDYRTKVLFMTDGILLREIHEDKNLSKYSVIMIDEAHERSINIDFTLGLLKRLLKRRDDLKVVISSASIDAEKFSRYFGGAPIIEVSGHSYPVEIIHSDSDYILFRIESLVRDVVARVLNIHKSMPEGDILVFMTGQDDISEVARLLEEDNFSQDMKILQAHGNLSMEEQGLIFQNFPGKRKVIVATNIAETSITIDGVVYVVDSGLIKQVGFDKETGFPSLDRVQHSRAGCIQRAGRAGRTQAGICYRMYTSSNFQKRQEYTTPEILLKSLTSTVLAMEALEIENIEGFEFLDAPDPEAFHEAYEMLEILGAIEKDKVGLTEIGRIMADLPLDPSIARMLLEAEKYGCVIEVATIASFFSVKNVFRRPKDKETDADVKHYSFKANKSDALTFLRIWNQWSDANFDRKWCEDNFLDWKALEEARSIRSQLFDILKKRNRVLSSNKDEAQIRRAISAGLIQNLFRHHGRYEYVSVHKDFCYAYIHPGSAVFGFNPPKWFVAKEVVKTTKSFARGITTIEVEWLPELDPKHFRFADEKYIISYNTGDDFAIVIQDILEKELNQWQVIARREIRVSLEEASQIQATNIAMASVNKLFSAIFKYDVGSFGQQQLFGFVNGMRFVQGFSSSVIVEEGCEYYCSFQNSIFSNETAVYPKFRIYDFPQTETVESPCDLSVATAAARLKEAWGIK